MTDDSRFSNREIQLMFDKIEILLKDIKKDISDTNVNFDRRVTRIEEDVEDLKQFQTRAMIVWSIGIVVIGWFINNYDRFF